MKVLNRLRFFAFVILIEILLLVGICDSLFYDIDTIELYLMLSGGIYTFLDSLNIVISMSQISRNINFYLDNNSELLIPPNFYTVEITTLISDVFSSQYNFLISFRYLR